jgi:hypothetical protein
VEDAPEHLLAPPFGLPGDLDARLLRHLREEDWASALVLLRDAVSPEASPPTWLVLLAYVRFRDAAEVMVEELADACREALALLDAALERGASLEAVTPLREAVELALDEVSREELRLEALAAGEGGVEALDDARLEALAFHRWKARPLEAAALFERLGQRRSGPARLVTLARAALCRAEAGALEAARPGLEAALAGDWSDPSLARERGVLEAVETRLLLLLPPGEVDVAWRLAEVRGRAVGLPFPSIWPHQERLLERSLELQDGVRARALARLIDERPERSRAVAALVRRALERPA